MINYNNLLDPTTQDYLTFQEPFTFSDKEDSLEPAAKKKTYKPRSNPGSWGPADIFIASPFQLKIPCPQYPWASITRIETELKIVGGHIKQMKLKQEPNGVSLSLGGVADLQRYLF